MPTLQELSQQLLQNSTPNTAKNYDAQYESTRNQIAGGLASLGSEQEQRTRRLGEDYSVASRDLAQGYQKQEAGLQQRLANQGILRSGINVGAQTNMAVQKTQDVGKLTQANTRGKEDIARDVAGRQQELQNQLSQAEVGRSERQTARELQEAKDLADAKAVKEAADAQRLWMEGLQTQLLSMAQPQPAPTGQMQPPPPPQQLIQQALQQLPPPKATLSPQQQVSQLGIDPRDLQQMLKQRGFDPGLVDGIFGKKSQLALAQWKQSIGLPATGDIDVDIWNQLQSSGTGTTPGSGPTIGVATPGPMKRAL